MATVTSETETTVEDLLEKPFLNRTLENKIIIISEGKPRPQLKISAVTVSDDGILKTEVFDCAMYDQVYWLTGSETQQCLFCWPCLLFTPKNVLWKVAVLSFLSDSIIEHEKTIEHIHAALNLNAFLSEHFKLIKVVVDDEQFNQRVHKNREIIKLLICAVCTAAARYQLPHGKNFSSNQIKQESCVKTLNFFRHYNARYLKYTDGAIEMIEVYPELLTNIVDAIRKIVNISIKKELETCTYASMILSDHSTDRSQSRISVILRYIRKSQVCERFIGFVNILNGNSTDVIYNLISSTVEEFSISNKFLAYSFDGAVLELSKLQDLICILEKKYPQAYFVPCYFHDIRYIIQQSLSSVHKELGRFFKTINVMETFFHKNENDFKAITRHQQYSKFRNLKSLSSLYFFDVLCKFKINFVETFKFVINRFYKWSAEDNIKSFILIQFLEDFQTEFLCGVFANLFELLVPLDSYLKDNFPRMTALSRVTVEILKKLNQARKAKYFLKHFNSTIEEMNSRVESESKRSKVDYSDLQVPCNTLYEIIINHLLLEIKSRFQHLDKLEFFSLIQEEHDIDISSVIKQERDIDISSLIQKYDVTSSIQEHTVHTEMQNAFDKRYLKLLHKSGLDYDLEQIRNEITVQRANGTIFKQKNPYDLLIFFEDADLKNTFKYTQKLVELILTMPFVPPVHGDLSKFQKIKQFPCSTNSMLTPGDISVLHIEAKFVQELWHNVSFSDEVIEKFYEKNKSIELMYKKQD